MYYHASIDYTTCSLASASTKHCIKAHVGLHLLVVVTGFLLALYKTLLSCSVQRLSKFTLFSNLRAFTVEDVDGNCHHYR
jgi:hypothetical protein